MTYQDTFTPALLQFSTYVDSLVQKRKEEVENQVATQALMKFQQDAEKATTFEELSQAQRRATAFAQSFSPTGTLGSKVAQATLPLMQQHQYRINDTLGEQRYQQHQDEQRNYEETKYWERQPVVQNEEYNNGSVIFQESQSTKAGQKVTLSGKYSNGKIVLDDGKEISKEKFQQMGGNYPKLLKAEKEGVENQARLDDANSIRTFQIFKDEYDNDVYVGQDKKGNLFQYQTAKTADGKIQGSWIPFQGGVSKTIRQNLNTKNEIDRDKIYSKIIDSREKNFNQSLNNEFANYYAYLEEKKNSGQERIADGSGRGDVDSYETMQQKFLSAKDATTKFSVMNSDLEYRHTQDNKGNWIPNDADARLNAINSYLQDMEQYRFYRERKLTQDNIDKLNGTLQQTYKDKNGNLTFDSLSEYEKNKIRKEFLRKNPTFFSKQQTVDNNIDSIESNIVTVPPWVPPEKPKK